MLAMEKKCLIILPAGDPEGYAKGHFNRVYQYVVVPACRLAGFSPVRIDDPTIETTRDIINTMIESSIVICDLSANSSAALYGFALRQAMNLPVVLIKDSKTNTIANIPEFEVLAYDDSLRIDTVQNEVDALSETLKNTFANKGEPNQLLARLNIGANQPTEQELTMELPMEIPVEDEKKESHLPLISPLPDYVGDLMSQSDVDRLKVGDSVFHINHGKGEILTISKMAKGKMAKIQFDSGSKFLVLDISGIFRKINS